MRVVRAAIVTIVTLSVIGCGGSKPPVMPDVVGKKLDVALSDVKRAAFNKDVEVLGGGVLGVIDKANWTVCEQEPAAGKAIEAEPRVKVDRTCGDLTPASSEPKAATSAPAPAATPTATPTLSAPPSPSLLPALTVANNTDFAALARLTDQCSDSQTEFATKYAGRVLQFDGSVGALANHGSFKTRFDILVTFGDNGLGTQGPNFQFRDVTITYDLHLAGPNIPVSMNVGDNLRITASVVGFEQKSCLFLLKPISTEYR